MEKASNCHLPVLQEMLPLFARRIAARIRPEDTDPTDNDFVVIGRSSSTLATIVYYINIQCSECAAPARHALRIIDMSASSGKKEDKKRKGGDLVSSSSHEADVFVCRLHRGVFS